MGAVGAAATEPQTFDPSKYSEDERQQGELIVAGMRGYGPRAGESQESLQKALDNDAYTQDAMSSQEVTGEKVINAVARGAAMAGAAVALGMGGNKLVQNLKSRPSHDRLGELAPLLMMLYSATVGSRAPVTGSKSDTLFKSTF